MTYGEDVQILFKIVVCVGTKKRNVKWINDSRWCRCEL